MTSDVFQMDLEIYGSILDFLPPHWRVLYMEGIKGYHLLFEMDDELTPKGEPSVNLCEESLSILQMASIPEMRMKIQSLHEEDRRFVFTLYKRLLNQVCLRLKRAAH